MTEAKVKQSIQRGLKQKGTIYRGSFSKYVEEELYKANTETVSDIATKYLTNNIENQ